MLMYGFWFHKPLNVVDPTVVDPGSLEELALSLMRSAGSAYEPFTTLKPQEQFQSPSLRNGTPRHARKYWKQNSKSASEASFLIFDTARLQFAKENEATLPILPIMEGLAVQKNSPENYGNDLVTERRVPSVSEQGKDAMGPAGAGFHRADTGALESQSQCPANKQLATFHRAHFPKADEAKTLVTGQILSSGIGPASLLTLTHRTQYFFWRSQISRLLRIRRLAPIAREVHVIDARLRTMMPDPVRSPGEELLFHGLAISLSQKDLLRWHRASIAFADEFSTQVEDEKIASYSPNRLSLPQPPGSVYRYYENSAGVDTRREDTVVTAPPDLRLQTLVTVPSVNTSLIYTFPNFVLRSLNLSLEAVSEILDGSLNVNAIVSIAAVSGIYASVHLALWNYDFPTETERLLWRIASCALGLPFALTTVVLMIATALFFPRYLASSIMSRGQVPVGYGSRAEYVRTNFRVQSSETVEQINAQSLPEESAERVDSIAEHFKTRAQALEAQEPPTTDRVSAHNEPILTTRTSTDDMSRPRQAPNDAVRGDQYSDTEHSRTWDLLRQTLRNPSAHPWMVCSLGILIIVLLPLIIVILGWILAALAAIILYVILYVLSRLYIVVEAFVSLRRVPMGV
ncbi:hypothetical protein H2200_012570 [Cladophialophora chaetospira]|uniref:Uncharacterized protein n=1 Tax=Cladophialophora chaetospira TaxID=386627 RepID=A0AA38WX80_9EURO|nr:hypothetical protein H2200_012570 [Cladophialophora chaetospira]